MTVFMLGPFEADGAAENFGGKRNNIQLGGA